MLEKLKSMENKQTESGKKILEFCLKGLGKSWGNKYVDVGCVDEINSIANIVLGHEIGGGYSTYLLYYVLNGDKSRFREVTEEKLLGGELIISPSGHGNGKLKNGHCGFFIGNGRIASNDSADGKLKDNYSLASWRIRYVDGGGFPMKFYRIIN